MYCNYSKDKFGNELTFIKPSWIPSDDMHIFTNYLEQCEKLYMDLISGIKRMGIVVMPGEKYTPQQARQILPNALKTEIIMTGFASDWGHFYDLRLFGKTGAPHPDMKLLAEKAQKAMQEAGMWEYIMSTPSKFE